VSNSLTKFMLLVQNHCIHLLHQHFLNNECSK